MGSAFAQKVGTAAAGVLQPQSILQQRDMQPTPHQVARATEAVAQTSATKAVADKSRTAQRPARVEGNFAQQESKDSTQKAGAGAVRAKQKHPDLGQEVDVTV